MVGHHDRTGCVLPRASGPGRVTPGGRRGAGNPRRPPRTCRQPATRARRIGSRCCCWRRWSAPD